MYQSTHTGAQVDEAVDKVLASPISMMSNRNLLDNWYFVGGGSQQGGGQFPINQRGQTSYTTYQTTIDRWTLFGGSVVLEADGITVTSSPDFGQAFEPSRLPIGTYTASVKTADGKIGSITFTTTGSQFFAGGAMGDTGVTLNFIDFWTSDKSLFSLQCQGVKIAAAKLEKGTVSTLANDSPPNYADELEICKYYYSAPTDVTATNVKLVNAPIIKVKDGVCYIYIQATSPSETLGTNWVKLFTVPSSVRPPVQVGCNLAIYPYRTPLFARLTTGGDFEVYNDQASIATNSQLNGFLAYPLLDERS